VESSAAMLTAPCKWSDGLEL